MIGHAGMFVLGAILLLLGTDSLAKGIASACARGAVAGHVHELASTVLNAVLPAAIIVATAAFLGQRELALGSIIGGATAQLGLVLGLAALVAPLVVRLKVFVWLNPALLIAVALLGVLAIDLTFDALDGAILLLAFLVVVFVFIRATRSERIAARAMFEASPGVVATGMIVLRIVVGAALACYAGWSLVQASIGLAAGLRWNPLLFGLVALGGVAALAGAPAAFAFARRGHGDFAVGQALLGPLANILLLLGLLAIGTPLALAPSLLWFDIPALFALALAVYPMMRSDGELSRREGVVLLLAYLLLIVLQGWMAAFRAGTWQLY